MSDPNQPYEPYHLPPGQFGPLRQRTGLPGWAIALIAGGVLATCLCVAIPIVSIGLLTLRGQRVSQVFSRIDTGLQSTETTTAIPIDTGKVVAIGQPARTHDLNITVTSAMPLTGIKDALKPPLGHEYYAVAITFENVAAEPVTLSAFTSSIQDNAGVAYSYSFAGERASSRPGFGAVQSLNPGHTFSGLLFYEVPQDATELFWTYKDIVGGGEVICRIK